MSSACVICLDDPTDSASEAIRCDQGHITCSMCLETYVSGEVKKLRSQNLLAATAATAEADGNIVRVQELSGCIFCPLGRGHGCTSEPYASRALAQHLTDETFEAHVGSKALLTVAREIQTVLQKGAELRSLFPNARQCKRCSFGPVVLGAGDCSDLQAHHGETSRLSRHEEHTADEESLIDNACPRCGWFGKRFDEWPVWDINAGVLSSTGYVYAPTDNVEATPMELVSEHTARDLERRAQRRAELREFRQSRHSFGMRWDHMEEMILRDMGDPFFRDGPEVYVRRRRVRGMHEAATRPDPPPDLELQIADTPGFGEDRLPSQQQSDDQSRTLAASRLPGLTQAQSALAEAMFGPDAAQLHQGQVGRRQRQRERRQRG